jgi:hypothetical protein
LSKTNGKRDVIEKIERWLDEETYKSEKSEKAYADFSVVIYPPNPNQNIGLDLFLEREKTDRITLAVNSALSQQDQKIFSYVKRDTRQKLLRELKYSLLQLNIQFTFHPNEETIESVLLSKRIYFDGLNKNIFFDAIFVIIRGLALINLKYQELLTVGSNPKISH